jgi:hypothetical protein
LEDFHCFHGHNSTQEIVTACQNLSLAFSRCALHDGGDGEAKLVTRLYQWLQERAMAYRAERVDSGRHSTVRTEVTVRQQEVTMLVSGVPAVGTCPLCGQVLGSGTTFLHGALVEGHPVAHGSCVGPQREQETMPAKKELP